MHDDSTERELRSLFQKLKSEEEQSVPPFEPLVRSAARRGQRSRRAIPLWAGLTGATAVAAALVLMLGIFPRRTQHPAIDSEAWSALSQWRASTDTFLVSSGPSWEGTTFTTPSDTWMINALETEERQSIRKETL